MERSTGAGLNGMDDLSQQTRKMFLSKSADQLADFFSEPDELLLAFSRALTHSTGSLPEPPLGDQLSIDKATRRALRGWPGCADCHLIALLNEHCP
jgi:hypothetical protein